MFFKFYLFFDKWLIKGLMLKMDCPDLVPMVNDPGPG